MVRDAAVDVVVLAVHVGGQRTTHGDQASPGGDGDEPPQRQQHPHQGVEADTGIDAHDAALEVDVVHLGQ